MAKVYFHIDLNAFFANAEILLDPSLKGKPVAVCGNTRRSVVSTASYEARAFGVHSAMPLSEAKMLCRDLIVVEGHYHFYRELSRDFIAIVAEYADELEQASIDECYADMTESIKRFEKPLDLAWTIQKRILNELGIPCSIGIAPNMFLAKTASDMKKPMGITVLRLREVPDKLWPLPIAEMRGVGKKTAPYLEEMGIHTIGDLARCKDTAALSDIFGKNTDFMIRRANGYDDRTIIKEWDARSMGVSETFLDDITDYDELRGILRALCRKLSERMRRERKAGRLITVRIKYYDFTTNDRALHGTVPVYSADDLFVGAIAVFDEHWTGEPVRLLGVSCSDFADESVRQMDLFDEELNKQMETDRLFRELNKEFSEPQFFRASDLLAKEEE
ncbi:MAG: DNA polymerase IV [Solobacterium sp.]|nr:DNA polymerase IV [Solobacterium sp.]